jgi:integrase
MARAVGHEWKVLWPKLKHLEEAKDTGKALTHDEQAAVLEAAKSARSKYIYPFLKIAFETGMRSDEIRLLKWSQVELGLAAEASRITVGQAKTAAGTGRVIPMTEGLWCVLVDYAAWLAKKLKAVLQPEWYIFPFSNRVKPVDPKRPLTTISSAWKGVRKRAVIQYRLHDTRHTFISRLAEADVSEITMKQLAGHVGKAMIERYSHIRMETKRAALEKALAEPRRQAVTEVRSDGAVKESAKVEQKKPTRRLRLVGGSA